MNNYILELLNLEGVIVHNINHTPEKVEVRMSSLKKKILCKCGNEYLKSGNKHSKGIFKEYQHGIINN